MNNLFDKKVFVTGILIFVAVFFLKKWMTKTVVKSDGTTSSYLGNEAIGYV